MVEKYNGKQVKVVAAAEQVAAPVPVHWTQVPTLRKYPVLQDNGIGPVVQAVALVEHGKHYPVYRKYPELHVAAKADVVEQLAVIIVPVPSHYKHTPLAL